MELVSYDGIRGQVAGRPADQAAAAEQLPLFPDLVPLASPPVAGRD
jgi:hypothetical protein